MSNSRGMGRREFLRTALAGAALATVGRRIAWAGASTTASSRPPNILVIISDEHNAGVTGCYGNRIVKTPNLDSLAAAGVSFENAYTNSPLCVPCRLSFTSGKYVSRVGAWNNDCRLPTPEYPSIARVMNAAGYESFLCGKMHYDSTCRYGFTEIGGNMNRGSMTGKGGRREADNLTPAKLSNRFDDFRTGDKSSVMNHDSAVAAGTVEFLQKRKKGDKPFFLVCGFLAPHFPLIVPEKHYEPYKGKVPMPEIPKGHLESLPLNYKHLRAGFGVVGVTDEIVRKGRELYYGLTQWVDERIGEVLAALAKCEAGDNTVVIYTTDHGENMGEHGLWWKNDMYEHAARVPLIVSWAQRWKGGQRRTGACSLVDVVQTVAEIGGGRTPDDWNGQSLCKWMDDAGAAWKDLAVSEYYAHNIASGFAMLRAGQYKYVYHTPPDDKHPAQRELYDLKADPGEFTNLSANGDQKDRVEKMHAALVKEVGEDPDKTELRCRADFAKGYGRVGGGKAGKNDVGVRRARSPAPVA